jgi:hypothetical protein
VEFQRVAPKGFIAESVKTEYLPPVREKLARMVVNASIDRRFILSFVLCSDAWPTVKCPQKDDGSNDQQ